MENHKEFSGLTDEEKELEKQALGMRLRADIDCPKRQVNLTTPPLRGMAYYGEDSKEIGSIIIRPEHIAFIAGKWCKQISRKARYIEIISLSREHQRRIEILARRLEVKNG